jgi:hypothetical protein
MKRSPILFIKNAHITPFALDLVANYKEPHSAAFIFCLCFEELGCLD